MSPSAVWDLVPPERKTRPAARSAALATECPCGSTPARLDRRPVEALKGPLATRGSDKTAVHSDKHAAFNLHSRQGRT